MTTAILRCVSALICSWIFRETGGHDDESSEVTFESEPKDIETTEILN